MTSALVGDKYYDDCPIAGKEVSSGRLIVENPAHPAWLVIAAQGPKSRRGVYLWQKGSVGSAPAERFVGLPDDATYAARPSALATGYVEDVDGSEFVLVGYRVLVGGGADRDALYLCEADFDPSIGAGACLPVYDADDVVLDVRDIEPDPTNPRRFFIADSGRRSPDGKSCETGEPTVYALDVRRRWTGSAWVWEFDLWDTDTQHPDPSWMDGATDYYLANSGACSSSGTDEPSWGELVPPDPVGTNEAHDITTIVADPTGTWLLAFFPRGNNNSRYGCVTAFRAPLASLAKDDPLAWEPLQDCVVGEMEWNEVAYPTSVHAAQRRAAVDARGGYMDDEPLLDAWGGTGVFDAVFVEAGTGVAVYDHLLVGANFHWWAFADSDFAGSDVGWDSTTGDLDLLDWTLAWAGDANGPVFQDLTAHGAAVCPGCASVGQQGEPRVTDTLLGGGAGDYKYAFLYGEYLGTRPPADRPCELQMVGSAGYDIDVWAPPGRADPAEAWMVLHPQSNVFDSSGLVVDTAFGRGLLYSSDGDPACSPVGETWCWDGIGADGGDHPGFIPENFANAPSTGWDMVCQDQGKLPFTGAGFPALYPADPFLMQDYEIGLIRALEPVGPGAAVLVTVAARLPSGADTPAGLVLAERTTSGLTYTRIGFDSDGAMVAAGCDEGEFFQFSSGTPNSRRLGLTVHPDTWAISGDEVRLFVSSSHPACGVAEVVFERGFEGDAAWYPVNMEHDGPDIGDQFDCDMLLPNRYLIQGVHASRDGRWLFAYGGLATTNNPEKTSICAIDLATGSAGAYWLYQPVAKMNVLQMAVWTLVSQPHVADAWYFGGVGDPACDACMPPGVFALQRKRRWQAGAWAWTWGFVRVADDDLQQRTVVDLDWGPGWSPGTEADARLAPAGRLYVSTAGGSWWDGEVTW